MWVCLSVVLSVCLFVGPSDEMHFIYFKLEISKLVCVSIDRGK